MRGRWFAGLAAVLIPAVLLVVVHDDPRGGMPSDFRDAPSGALSQLGSGSGQKPADDAVPSPLSSALTEEEEFFSAYERRLAGGSAPGDGVNKIGPAGAIAQGELNPRLLEFFTANYKRGAIVVIGADDALARMVRRAQRFITGDGKPSLWSHAFLFGDLKAGPDGRSATPYIYESDLERNAYDVAHKLKMRNGVQENWIGRWSTGEVKNAAIVDLGLLQEQEDKVIAAVLKLVSDRTRFSIGDLVGTSQAMRNGTQHLPNPSHMSDSAMYCSAMVRYCYEKAGRGFIGDRIDVFNTSPEDLVQMGIKAGAIKFYVP